MPNYWIIVGSPDNFEKTKELGFSIQGMKTRQRRKAERMGAGDQFVWYITGDQAFAGYATITGAFFEDHDPIWSSGKKKDEDYPWRVPIGKAVSLPATGGCRPRGLPASSRTSRNGRPSIGGWPSRATSTTSPGATSRSCARRSTRPQARLPEPGARCEQRTQLVR